MSGDESPEPGFAPGDRVGPYEIVGQLGAGGMGVVYRARDPRLERSVAIKVLPETATADRARRERFVLEARAIAQLQHPNVCTLFDVGEQAGLDYLVMELLEGESLEKRLERGALPLTELLAVGAAIAEALAAAHRQGILHRDLKPANVMLTRSGPKLLDFGLAKLRGELLGPVPDQATRTARALTAEGTLLGTLAYMAPEQLEGKILDERADLWALGCVLHEMATGARAFGAATPASTIAAILEREPRAVSEIAPLAPRAFDRIVRACLAKDPEKRWQSAGDLARELRWLAGSDSSGIAESAVGAAVAGAAGVARRRYAALAAGAGLLVAGLLAGWLSGRRASSTAGSAVSDGAPRGAVRSVLPIAVEGAAPMSTVSALSPDGRLVVLSGLGSGAIPLELLALDSERSHPIAGTEGASFAFWSPDSRSIAFFQRGYLKRLDLATSGADARTLCPIAEMPRGGSWSRNGTIIFSGGRKGALQRVSSTGGTPEPVTSLDASRGENSHRWPQFLPDGERFLYWATDNDINARDSIRIGALAGGDAPVLLENVSNGIFASGYLLFANRVLGLAAQPFDWQSGKLSGSPAAIGGDFMAGLGVSILPISASEHGDLLYLIRPSTWNTSLGWYDRAGNRLGTFAEEAPWSAARLSPDGKRIAVCLTDIKVTPYRTDLWVLDPTSGSRTRLTFEGGGADDPAWSPDGKRIAYGRFTDAGAKQIRVVSAQGGSDTPLLDEAALDDPELDWSPDGTTLAYTAFSGARGNYDIRFLDLASGKARDFLATDADEVSPRFSPDGRFVAYVSSDSGENQVFLRRIGSAERWQVSVDGGQVPRFARDGKELFFLDRDDRLRSVPVRLADEVSIGAPVLPAGARPFPVTRWFFLELEPFGNRVLADAPPPGSLDPKYRYISDWPSLLSR